MNPEQNSEPTAKLPPEIVLREPQEKSTWTNPDEQLRESWASTMFIAYNTVERALADAWGMISRAASSGKPYVMLVTGESGSGKTAFAEELAYHVLRAYARTDPERQIVPVVHVSAPDPCTPKELCIQILKALGDPFPRKREKAELTRQTILLIRECCVRAVLFDNFHDVPVKRASRGIDQVLTRLRDLIDGSSCLWVFLGTKEARAVIRSEKQIARRTPHEVELEYLSLRSKDTRRVFVRIVKGIDRWIPLEQSTEFRSLTRPIYLATEGIFSRIIELFDAAWRNATSAGRRGLEKCDFFEAFHFVHGVRNGVNPFDPSFVERRLHDVNEPYEVLRAP